MRTSTYAIINLTDVTSIADATYITNSLFNYCDLDNIKKENYSTKKYATCELNSFLLDGSFEEMDELDENDFSYWSGSLSKGDGTFDITPTIISNFSFNHSSAGLTVNYDSNYPLPKEVTFTFYDSQDNVINSIVDYPTDYNHTLDIPAENYRKFVIEFNEVKPYSRARIKNIVYGIQLLYSSESNKNLSKASVLEEVDITSKEIAVNTSTLTVIDKDNYFSITNPRGVYKFLQKRQKIGIYERIEGEEDDYVMAMHYLKSWSTKTGAMSTFKCMDIIGCMDDTTFPDHIYENKTAGYIIDEIMDDFGFSDYYVDPDIRSIVLNGAIKECSHREALQQVAFACCATVDTSRITGINIYKASLATQSTISKSRIFMSPERTITQNDLVTKVIVYNHTYALDEKGEIVDEDGKTYSYKETEEQLDYANVKEVKNASLVDANNSKKVANYLYDYYQYRLNHSFKIIVQNEKAGNMCAVQLNDSMVPVLITSIDIDLTGGFVAKIKGIGNSFVIPNEYYARESNFELYANDMGVI